MVSDDQTTSLTNFYNRAPAILNDSLDNLCNMLVTNIAFKRYKCKFCIREKIFLKIKNKLLLYNIQKVLFREFIRNSFKMLVTPFTRALSFTF